MKITFVDENSREKSYPISRVLLTVLIAGEHIYSVSQVVGSRPDVFSCELNFI